MIKSIADIDCIHKLNDRHKKNLKTIARLEEENRQIPKRIKQVQNMDKNQLSLNDLIITR